jgi:protein-tyrosine sulfotransferase
MKFEDTIIILGVPRSGTTLLRVLLGGHSQIAALPETPWITGSQEIPSLRQFLKDLESFPANPVDTIREVTNDTMLKAARDFFKGVVEPVMQASDKERLLIKTPDDIKYLDFLEAFFKGAKFLHITRDGRDVALSTVKGRKDLLGAKLADYGLNNMPNTIRRWFEWECLIEGKFADDSGSIIHLKYEDLVLNAEVELERICAFLGLDFEPEMVDYGKHSHVFPSWEQGSKDVKEQGGLNTDKVSRWKKDMAECDMLLVDQHFSDALIRFGYQPCHRSIEFDGAKNLKKLKWSTDRMDFRARRNFRVMRCLHLPIRLLRTIVAEIKRAFIGK